MRLNRQGLGWQGFRPSSRIEKGAHQLGPRAAHPPGGEIGVDPPVSVPVHLYGLCADMDPLLAIAGEAGVPIIEDACQAIGATYEGRQAGVDGPGGMLFVLSEQEPRRVRRWRARHDPDRALAQKVRLLRNHGSEAKYYHQEIGGNFRLDALQAAILRVKLPHLSRGPQCARRMPQRIGGSLPRPPAADIVSACEPDGCFHIYNQFVVRVPERDRVRAFLTGAWDRNRVYYPVPFHLQECFGCLGYRRGDFPAAEAAAGSTLALPIYGELTDRAAGDRRRGGRRRPGFDSDDRRNHLTGAAGQLGRPSSRDVATTST